MRWLWIDRVLELTPGERIVAVKCVTLSEDLLHDHFGADPATGREALPVMPASLIVEGVAQSAGMLIGHAWGFREKVVLAKIARVEFTQDVTAGVTLRYTASITQMTPQGASTSGIVEVIEPARAGEARRIGIVDLIFSNIDQNMAGAKYGDSNFVFGGIFRTLMRMSGTPEPVG